MLLSDAVRNVVYPGALFCAVGSLWIVAWAGKVVADQPSQMQAPAIDLQQMFDDARRTAVPASRPQPGNRASASLVQDAGQD
jgi:hypothetical protein